MIALTKSLGKETATTRIRVNCITSAAIKTALFDLMTPQQIEFMLSKIPAGRFGTIEEATSFVCWLASDDCSSSTATAFDLSGGQATYCNDEINVGWACVGFHDQVLQNETKGCRFGTTVVVGH